jgi:nifR3 family TIM-barrel protein
MNLNLSRYFNISSDNIPLALAPMECITDTSYRQICKSYGADILFTEFIAADGLIRDAVKSLRKLSFNEAERPIGIQVFGNNVQSMVEAVKIIESVSPDFIDLNYGCPVKKVVDKGGGAAMLKDIPKMLEITQAVVKATSVPISVKTRLGWDEKNIVIEALAEQLQDCGIQMLTIHGRTKSQMYKGVADWNPIAAVKSNPRIQIPIIGNGDIDSPEKAKEIIEKYPVDGLMIGRGSIGNPWIFKEIKDFFSKGVYNPFPTIDERISVCKLHLNHSIEIKGERTAILETRKHYSGIFRSLPDFKPFRLRLVTAETLEVLNEIFSEIRMQYAE